MEEDLKGLDLKSSKSIAKKSIVVDFFRPLQIASACRENNIKFEKERLSSGNNLKLSRCFQTWKPLRESGWASFLCGELNTFRCLREKFVE